MLYVYLSQVSVAHLISLYWQDSWSTLCTSLWFADVVIMYPAFTLVVVLESLRRNIPYMPLILFLGYTMGFDFVLPIFLVMLHKKGIFKLICNYE